jgi:hypothetical protein
VDELKTAITEFNMALLSLQDQIIITKAGPALVLEVSLPPRFYSEYLFHPDVEVHVSYRISIDLLAPSRCFREHPSANVRTW